MNAYEVKAGIGVIVGNTVLSMPECLECKILQKVCYINTLPLTLCPAVCPNVPYQQWHFFCFAQILNGLQ